jgi:hypothetical protein
VGSTSGYRTYVLQIPGSQTPAEERELNKTQNFLMGGAAKLRLPSKSSVLFNP